MTLSKFCTKLVVVYQVSTNDVFSRILEECYANYEEGGHHFRVSIPLQYDYVARKYISRYNGEDYDFWINYIKGMKFIL